MTAHSEQFLDQARKIAADLRHRGLIQTALKKYEVKRDEKKAAFQD